MADRSEAERAVLAGYEIQEEQLTNGMLRMFAVVGSRVVGRCACQDGISLAMNEQARMAARAMLEGDILRVHAGRGE